MAPLIGVIFTLIASAAAAPQVLYQSRYDHLDVESILNNRRMVNYYAACLLSTGPCTPQGLDLKRVLPEALQSSCGKCTEKQRTAAYRTIKRLKKEYPKIWEQLVAVWDPDEVLVGKFEASFEAQNAIGSDPSPPPPINIFNRFGETEEANSATNVAVSSPPPSTTSTTTRTTSTTLTNAITSTSTNKPTTVFVTKPPQAPPFPAVGANLQATVSFMAALKKIVIQLYQHKLETINRILSGR